MLLEDYKTAYEEAMAASNEAGYVGLTPAQTIRAQDELIKHLRVLEEKATNICKEILNLN